MEAALAALDAPEAEARRRAERTLSAVLGDEHLPLVAAAATRSAEVRRRLALALSADDGRLGLVTLLLVDADREVQALGRSALEGLARRWSPSALDPPARRRSLPDAWLQDGGRAVSLDARRDSLPLLVDRLDRLAGAPAPIVLDPELAGPDYSPLLGPRAVQAPFVGSWTAVLLELVRQQRVGLVVIGHRPEGDDEARRSRAIVLITRRGAETEARVVDLLERWILGVLRPSDTAYNGACARSLAALEWPAADRWLEARYRARREPAVLDGLLVAAARGRVAPSLADGSELARDLAALDARLSQEPDLAGLAGRALAQVGPTGANGRSLLPALFGSTPIATRPARARWLRWTAAEGFGLPDERYAAQARAALARVEASNDERLAALRALVVLQGAEPTPLELSGTAGLLQRGAAAGYAPEVGELLARVGARPAPGEAAPSGPLEARLAWLEWQARRGALDAARVLLQAEEAGADPARLGAGLKEIARRGGLDALRALVDGYPRPGPEWVRARRLELELVDEAGRRELLDELLARPSRSAADWRLVGLLAVDARLGWRAREALVTGLQQGVDGASLLPAIDLALAGLARSGQEAWDTFQSRLRAQASLSQHPLAATFLNPSWPPAPGTHPLELHGVDRHLP